MSEFNNLQDVFTLWTTDSHFKETFKKNPSAALAQAGIQLSPEDYKKAVQRFGGKDPNIKLDDRINK